MGVVQLRQEMTRLRAEVKQQEQARKSVEDELAKSRKDAEAELAQVQKHAMAELTKVRKNAEAELDKVRKNAEAELDKARQELAKRSNAEQAAQLRALAERAELEERLKASDGEITELRAKLDGGEKLWSREREKLIKSVETLTREKTEIEGRRQAELATRKALIAALDALARVVPGLADQPVESSEFAQILKDYLAGRRRLEDRIVELERMLEDDHQKLAEADANDARFGGLIALNRSLQEELDGMQAGQQLLEKRLTDLKAEAVSAARQELLETRRELDRLQGNITTLTKENQSLLGQLQQENRIAVLSPERVSMMLNDFQQSLQTGMKGVEIREGEVKLKIGIAAVDEQNVGFVIPSATNIEQVREGLSEINFRFGKQLGLEPGQ
jgi:chromosome segregation ATPase